MRGGTAIKMQKYTVSFLMCLVATHCFAGAGGNIGLVDDRRYGSLEEPLYSAIGRLSIGCTAGFVSNNLIITNQHCVPACNNGCTIHFFDGKQYQDSPVQLVALPAKSKTRSSDGTDWAIFKSAIPNNNFKSVAPKTTLGTVNRGGFGLLRVIDDSEIPELKQIYANVTKQRAEECKQAKDALSCIHKYVNQELDRRGIKPLFGDSKNFKVQECTIREFVDNGKMTDTNCDSSGGDSGAPLLRGNEIVALNNSGPQTVFGKDDIHGARALNTSNFYEAVKNEIRRANATPSNPAPSNPGASTTPGEPAAPSEPGTTGDPNVVTDPTTLQSVINQALTDFQCD